MFALKPAFIYSCSQLLEASRFGHFVLRSLQNGSTEANAATVTQKTIFFTSTADSCNASVFKAALRPETIRDARELFVPVSARMHICVFPWAGRSVSHCKPRVGNWRL